MINKKMTIVGIISISISLILVCIGFYSIIPKTSTGYIGHIGLLKEKYSLYNITNFKTKGDLFFIEEHYFLSHKIIVFGFFNDDINIFQENNEIKEFTIINSESFYLPQFVDKVANILQSNYHIKKTNKSNEYVFIDTNKILQYSFRIKGSRHWIIIDPTSRYFVMRTSTR